jgi:hypothetical protein
MVTLLSLIAVALISTSALAGMCGGPLNSVSIPPLQVQDQDGLGTCYANQASLLIQNALGPTQRPVSYQQLGMAYAGYRAEVMNLPNSSLVRSNNNGEQRFVTEGGDGCLAFAAAREQGFCNSRTFQRLERTGIEDPQRYQSYYLLMIGQFFDSQRRALRGVSEEGWANLEQNIADFLVEQRQGCEMSDQDMMAISFGARTSDLVAAATSIEQACTIGYPLCGKSLSPTEADAIRSALQGFRLRYFTADRTPITNGRSIRLNADAVQLLSARSWGRVGWGPAFSDLLTRDVEASLAQTLPAARARELAQGLIPPADITRAARDARQSMIPPIECTDPWAVYATLRRTDRFNLSQATQQGGACIDPGVLSEQSVREIAQFANRVTTSLREQQSGNLRDRLRSILNVIAPACTEELETNRTRLASLTCKQVRLSEVFGPVRGPHVQSDSSLVSLTPQVRRARADVQIESALCAGRAVGVDVCTAFMDSATAVDSDFCRRPLPGIAGHSYHAMTIVSAETQPNGRKRYLVQNSWGRSCDFPLTLNGSALMSCETQADNNNNNRLTGRFWVDADLLLNNTGALNILQGR